MKKKAISAVLAVIMSIMLMLTMMPASSFVVYADEGSSTVSREKTADSSTINDWEKLFGSNIQSTKNAGVIWTDKSVLKDLSNSGLPGTVTLNDDDNFIVAMSALASNKSIVGHSTIPTDTMLVLDVSGSMKSGDTTGNIDAMVKATNDAIYRLQELNNHNRVGVVLYSGNEDFGTSTEGTAKVLLPLDRYVKSGNTSTGKEFLTYTASYKNNKLDNINVDVASNVKNSKGENIAQNDNDKDVEGGTYTQNGLFKAYSQFMDVDDVTVESGAQAGTVRMPVFVLMTDGAPTTATTSYWDVSTSDVGNGANSCSTDEVAFLNQLTAAFVSKKVEDHYGQAVKFYTLGLGLSSLDNDAQNVAESVLDPETSSIDLNGYWEKYVSGGANAKDMVLTVPGTNTESNPGNKTVTVRRNENITSRVQQYYVDEYFPADNAEGLIAAFTSIVDEIILQSKYYPTNVKEEGHDLSGYITFEDAIGAHMEVKDIKGIVVGNTTFTGEEMAKIICEGDLGTINNPSSLGKEFISSVKIRLGLSSDQEAHELINSAKAAGQFAYEKGVSYSNYAGWYSGSDGSCLGFWDESHTGANVPTGALYINKSYGFYGNPPQSESIKNSDMMYMSVRVRTEITVDQNNKIVMGDQFVDWKIPAALVPTVTYNVEFDGNNYENATDFEVTVDETNPIRLVYEVGLLDDINELNVAEKMQAAAHSHTDGQGNYLFYTNKWGGGLDSDGNHQIDYSNPFSHIVTIAEYEPAEENENYYFIENSPIYVKDGNDYELAESTDENEQYYFAHNIFAWDANGKNAHREVSYEEISKLSLSKAEEKDDGTYYIPLGTVRKTLRNLIVEKSENETDTLTYSHYATVTNASAREHYHADIFLGNNGRIKMTPATGIALTKEIDMIQPGGETDFNFKITLTPADGKTLKASYPYVLIKKDGSKETGTASVNNGVLNANLSEGQTIYITDLDAGTTYSIEENLPAGSKYKVGSVSVDNSPVNNYVATGTVTEKNLSKVKFVNTPNITGSLIINKVVEHPFGDNYQIPNGMEFDVVVTLTGNEVANRTYDVTGATNVSQDKSQTGKAVLNFTIKPNETVSIHGIPSGTAYSVSEVNTDGFTLTTAVLEGVIPQNSFSAVTLVNKYTPSNVTFNGSVTGKKILEGREWKDSDSFEFELQKHTKDGWETIAKENVNINENTFDFTTRMEAETYNAIGTYSYRILETEGSISGVTYDKTIGHFNVVVTDGDMDGDLEYAVEGTNPVVVNNGDVSVDFNNVYAPEGSAHIDIEIKKYIDNSTGVDVPLNGYTFSLWDNDKKVMESTETNSVGEAVLRMVYSPDNLIENGKRLASKEYTYTLKEDVPTIVPDGMSYSQKEYEVVVKLKDTTDGYIDATVELTKIKDDRGLAENNTGSSATPGTNISNVAQADFTNFFTLDEAALTIGVDVPVKKLFVNENGSEKELKGGEFEFAIYATDAAFDSRTLIDSVQNDDKGNVKFEEVTYPSIGTYYYVIKELLPDNPDENIEYDSKEYHVVVTVTQEGKALAAKYEITSYGDLSGQGQSSSENIDEITFTNVYKPELPTGPDEIKDPDGSDELDEDPFVKAEDEINTGDSFNILVFAVIAIVALVGAAAALFRRKK